MLFILFQQPTWRLWGEEKADGALYTVYLKKVRYHRPTKGTSFTQSVSGNFFANKKTRPLDICLKAITFSI